MDLSATFVWNNANPSWPGLKPFEFAQLIWFSVQHWNALSSDFFGAMFLAFSLFDYPGLVVIAFLVRCA